MIVADIVLSTESVVGLDEQQRAGALKLNKLLSNQVWRLNNLYQIRDKDANQVCFVMNASQEYLYYHKWFLNIILKARQIGFTTFIDLLILDTCLFNPNIKAGIIAHHKDDAQAIYEEKIIFPYDLPSLRLDLGQSSVLDQ